MDNTAANKSTNRRSATGSDKNKPRLKKFCEESAAIATGLQAQIATHLRHSIDNKTVLSPKDISMFGRTLESCHLVGANALRQADKVLDLDTDLFIGDKVNPRFLPAENASGSETLESIRANEVWKIDTLQKALHPGLENGDLEAVDRWVKLQEIKLQYIGDTPEALEIFAALVQEKMLPKEVLVEAYALYDNFRQNLNALLLKARKSASANNASSDHTNSNNLNDDTGDEKENPEQQDGVSDGSHSDEGENRTGDLDPIVPEIVDDSVFDVQTRNITEF